MKKTYEPFSKIEINEMASKIKNMPEFTHFFKLKLRLNALISDHDEKNKNTQKRDIKSLKQDHGFRDLKKKENRIVREIKKKIKHPKLKDKRKLHRLLEKIFDNHGEKITKLKSTFNFSILFLKIYQIQVQKDCI